MLELLILALLELLILALFGTLCLAICSEAWVQIEKIRAEHGFVSSRYRICAYIKPKKEPVKENE